MVNGGSHPYHYNNMMIASASAPPPPPPPPPRQSSNSSHQAQAQPRMWRNPAGICPVCDSYYHHEKALNGHMRWHSAEERIKAGYGVAAAMAAAAGGQRRYKTPDLNRSPPPELEDGQEGYL